MRLPYPMTENGDKFLRLLNGFAFLQPNSRLRNSLRSNSPRRLLPQKLSPLTSATKSAACSSVIGLRKDIPLYRLTTIKQPAVIPDRRLFVFSWQSINFDPDLWRQDHKEDFLQLLSSKCFFCDHRRGLFERSEFRSL